MTEAEIIFELERQLAIDYDCAPEEVRGADNVFRPMRSIPGARPIGGESCALKLCIYREKLLVMANEELLPWCGSTMARHPARWFAEPFQLRRLEGKLAGYGFHLADTRHHYVPTGLGSDPEPRFPVRWYEGEELEQFRGDGRFWEALLFDGKRPDMLAVTAMEGETVLGMAAATRDSEKVWEIGVNTCPEGAGLGVGSYVVALLKNQLLRRGVVPTYSTAESHIKSQRVAFRAGFVPAFYELCST